MSITWPPGIQLHTRVVRLQGGGLRFLDAVHRRVVTRPARDADSQHWRIIDVGAGVCVVQQVNSGRFLDATGERVVTRPQRDDDSQRWRVEDFGGGFVTLEQVSSGRFLEASVDGEFAVVVRPPGDNEQTWRLSDP